MSRYAAMVRGLASRCWARRSVKKACRVGRDQGHVLTAVQADSCRATYAIFNQFGVVA